MKTNMSHLKTTRENRKDKMASRCMVNTHAPSAVFALRVTANFFENGGKKLRIQTKTDTCGGGLIVCQPASLQSAYVSHLASSSQGSTLRMICHKCLAQEHSAISLRIPALTDPLHQESSAAKSWTPIADAQVAHPSLRVEDSYE